MGVLIDAVRRQVHLVRNFVLEEILDFKFTDHCFHLSEELVSSGRRSFPCRPQDAADKTKLAAFPAHPRVFVSAMRTLCFLGSRTSRSIAQDGSGSSQCMVGGIVS